MYNKHDICAVIVSYNPSDIILSNIESLLSQVEKCVVVDNGSENIHKIVKDLKSKVFDVAVLPLEKNHGIAYALNRGYEYCINHEYRLMLTMDQDTVLDTHAVEKLLLALNSKKANAVGINWDKKISEDKSVDFLITSGNLVEVESIEKIGGYDEKLFIDSVDFDFSLRLIEHGYKLLKVADAYANHAIGEGLTVKFFGKKITYFTHSPERYYYISRNHYYILQKYSKHIVFCLKKRICFLYDKIRMVLLDEQRCEKMDMIRRGKRDFKLDAKRDLKVIQ